MRKRLCVREPVGEDASATQGGLFALLPDELIIEVMSFCEPRSLSRLACASMRLASLAADSSLWRRLYLYTFPPCTRSGLACLADAIDAWHFAPEDGGVDGLDHGPAAGDMRLDDRRQCATDDATCWSDGPTCALDGDTTDRQSTHTKDTIQSMHLSRWWNLRCARLTRLAAERVTGTRATPAHVGCRHVPPSLVRARGYRWAYAMAALMPLVRKTRHDADHAHRIVHRGSPDGLAVQCEVCLAPGRPCGSVTWRWGRFADCFLSGLGTEAATLASPFDQDARQYHNQDNGQGNDSVDSAASHGNHGSRGTNKYGGPLLGATTVIAGFWVDGVPHATHARRGADGEIVIGTASDSGGFEPSQPDLMDEDRTAAFAVPNMAAARDQDGDRDDDDDDIYTIASTTACAHTPTVIYYALGTLSNSAWSYEGERLGGRRQGYGVLSCEALPAPTYEGDWRADAWHGRGTLKGRDGATVFEGRFVRGRPCGRGVLYLCDGLCVEASWHALSDGTIAPRHIGHIVYANGDRVLCDWGRPKAGSHAVGADPVTVRGFRFADGAATHTQKEGRDDPALAVFAGREVGAEWGPWPTECAAEPTVVDVLTVLGPLPLQSGGDPGFCERAWRVTLPAVFWPPMRHPLETLFARYVDEDRIGWRGCRARAPRFLDTPDPCAP
ncbi:F-box domain containing protein [Pandoravirus macleodensis]|uniref:F-box domain containing protein n=1 Tax=Pandoravirus macleodensis TaxID=2107707 RepID=A0A2U7UFK2_9VIRU|nr:F-box domain containing protein [Pandoravirus macleodensis]AVK77268.1 F-box domain containing protein [Pandoravirus macleodensis]